MRAIAVKAGGTQPADSIVLDAQGRNVRRRLVVSERGEDVLVDLPKPVLLAHGDCLVLEDGRLIEVIAAPEELLELKGGDAEHLTRLAWHIGNRHLEAQIERDRILIRRDHVIAQMLALQGATVREVTEPFHPERGAYHAH